MKESEEEEGKKGRRGGEGKGGKVHFVEPVAARHCQSGDVLLWNWARNCTVELCCDTPNEHTEHILRSHSGMVDTKVQ